jgi:ATP-dependent DNA ligase
MNTPIQKADEIKIRGSIANMRWPAWGSVKYDGEYTWMYRNGDTMYTVNKYGRIRVPGKYNNLFRNCHKVEADSFILLGELHYHGGKNGDLYGLLKNKTHEDLSFSPFDIWMYNDYPVHRWKCIERLELMEEIHVVDRAAGWLLRDLADAYELFENSVRVGYEGIVVKDLNSKLSRGDLNQWVKMKYKDTNNLPVTMVDHVKDRIEVSHNGKIVGVKVSRANRRYLSPGMLVKIEHQGVLPSGSLRHPVFKGPIPPPPLTP